MAMPARPLDSASRRWTPDEVDALDDPGRAWPRYEGADGELLVTPAPSIDHRAVVGCRATAHPGPAGSISRSRVFGSDPTRLGAATPPSAAAMVRSSSSPPSKPYFCM